MPEKVWQGGHSGSETSYTEANNWVGGVAPVNGDDVVIAPHPTTGTSHNIVGSDQSTTTLASFKVHKNYAGNLGSSSTYLKIDAADFKLKGSGDEMWIQATNGGSAIDSFEVEMTHSVQASNRTTKGVHLIADDDITILSVAQGVFTLEAASTGTVVEVANQGSSASVYLDNLATTVHNEGSGTIVIHADAACTTIENHGSGTISVLDGGAGTIKVHAGRVSYQSPDNITTIVEMHGSGTFDNSSNQNAITINAAKVYGSGTLDDRNGRGTTFTSAPQKLGTNATIYYDALSSISATPV